MHRSGISSRQAANANHNLSIYAGNTHVGTRDKNAKERSYIEMNVNLIGNYILQANRTIRTPYNMLDNS